MRRMTRPPALTMNARATKRKAQPAQVDAPAAIAEVVRSAIRDLVSEVEPLAALHVVEASSNHMNELQGSKEYHRHSIYFTWRYPSEVLLSGGVVFQQPRFSKQDLLARYLSPDVERAIQALSASEVEHIVDSLDVPMMWKEALDRVRLFNDIYLYTDLPDELLESLDTEIRDKSYLSFSSDADVYEYPSVIVRWKFFHVTRKSHSVRVGDREVEVTFKVTLDPKAGRYHFDD